MIISTIAISIFAFVSFDRKYDEISIDWMSKVSDDVNILDLSIPGTHDSGAQHSIADVAGKCQDLSISSQLEIGVRFLDIRLQLVNDEFRVVYRSIKEYNIWIYNRWGHLVYKSNDPAKGWDGTIGGRPAAEGAYYYVIRALGTDAEMGYMMKPKYTKKLKKQDLPIGVYQLSGDINLLRGK